MPEESVYIFRLSLDSQITTLLMVYVVYCGKVSKKLQKKIVEFSTKKKEWEEKCKDDQNGLIRPEN